MSEVNPMKRSKYSIFVLHNGYSFVDSSLNEMKANCTCTLIKGSNNIIVDTMTPWDKDIILKGLEKHALNPENIDYVICTHGHSDHIGNNNLFLNAKHIVGTSVSYMDIYDLKAFEDGSDYDIDEFIKIVITPGHTLNDISVIVKTEHDGVYGITGDLFENETDIDNPNIWINAGSEAPNLQKQNRLKIAEIVDWIIPGHGVPFKSSNHIINQLKLQSNSSNSSSNK